MIFLKRFAILLFFLCLINESYAQQTLRMMHYNLLFYGNPFACDESDNNTETKDIRLREIVEYIQPDIITVNELSSDEVYADRLRDDVLNSNGINYWERAATTNTSWDSGIVNMLYYNSDKYTLSNQEYAYQSPSGPSLVRVVDLYSLYDNISAASGDTVFFHVVVAHLHSSDMDMRTLQCEAAMELIEGLSAENIILSGDLNLDSSSEYSYQVLTNGGASTNFFDPIDAPGTWSGNSAFAYLHSQSTHQSSGCPSGGGMDDRFDFTLISEAVMNNTQSMQYQSSSYRVLGNDGNNFNQSLHISNNGDVPTEIAIALYSVSDHLPIITDYIIDNTVGIGEEKNDISMTIHHHNNSLSVRLNHEGKYQVRLIDMQGRIVFEKGFTGNSYTINTSNLSPAIYVLNLTNESTGAANNQRLILTQ